MKLSKQIMKLMENEQPSTLSEEELKKFWKDMQENIFKYSKQLVKDDRGLFYGSTDIAFSSVGVTGDFGKGGNDPDNDAELDSDFFKDPENYLNSLELKSISPKELVQMVLNDYTLDRESTEEEDDQAFEYFLKHLKGQDVYFYGETTVDGSKGEDDAGEWEIGFEGTAKIKNFKYDANSDELEITSHDIVKLSVNYK